MIVIQAIRDLFADVFHHLKAEAADEDGISSSEYQSA